MRFPRLLTLAALAAGHASCVLFTGSTGGYQLVDAGADGSPGVQLCTTDAECGDASCVSQKCALGATTVSVQACGNVPGCSP
jgi:hypothetical protein